jgi:hypothetical protein
MEMSRRSTKFPDWSDLIATHYEGLLWYRLWPKDALLG